MFSKRTFKKTDILAGIEEGDGSNQQTKEDPRKKLKVDQALKGVTKELMPVPALDSMRPNYLPEELDDIKNQYAVEVERYIVDDDRQNPVAQTIRKFKNITSIDQIDPKKPLPKVDEPKQHIKRSKFIAPSNVRFTSRFDYNPSLCKDYHDTGYCTFGDSCIYIHDRGDYKSGWEIEKDWEEEQKRLAAKEAKRQNGEISSDEELQEDLAKYPVAEACPICEQELQQPVVTKCNHFFCEKCAIQHNRQSPKCFVCGKDTRGTFANAKDIIKRNKAKRDEVIKNYNERKPQQQRYEENQVNESLYLAQLKQNLVDEDAPQIVTQETTDQHIQELQNELERIQAKRPKGFQRSESDWQI